MMSYNYGREFWSDKNTDHTNHFLCDYPFPIQVIIYLLSITFNEFK